MAKPTATIPAGNPIKPPGMPSATKQAGPPMTKSGPVSKPGGKVDNCSK